MKNFLMFLLLGLTVYSCQTTGKTVGQTHDPYDTDTLTVDNDTVRIANDSLEYEIIVIEPGFSTFLVSQARPEGYYSLSYLENKNKFLVTEYNQRVNQPFRYDTGIYSQEINYDPQIDYGYEVNYKLYYYFVFLSQHYNQRFSVPTRL